MKNLTKALSKREFLTLCTATLIPLSTHANTNYTLPLDNYKGKIILVDFWASWCVPCRKSFPWLNEVSKRYQDQGLIVLGVNVDEKKQDAEQFLEAIPAEFPIIYDPNGDYASNYSVKVMPTSLLFDRNGNHATTHAGFLTKKIPNYEAELKTLLNI